MKEGCLIDTIDWAAKLASELLLLCVFVLLFPNPILETRLTLGNTVKALFFQQEYAHR